MDFLSSFFGSWSMRGVPGIFKSAVRSFRYSGFRRSVQQARRRLVPTVVFDTDVFLINRFDFTDLDSGASYPFAIRSAYREDRERLTLGGLPVSTIDHFFDVGGHPVIVEEGGVAIGYSWATSGGWDIYDWLRFEVGPDEVWGAAAFVVPAYRGKEIGAMMKRFMYGKLAEEGYLRAWTLIEKLNVLSKHAAAKVPQRAVARVFYIRFLGLTVVNAAGRWFMGFWGPSKRLIIPVSMFKGAEPDG